MKNNKLLIMGLAQQQVRSSFGVKSKYLKLFENEYYGYAEFLSDWTIGINIQTIEFWVRCPGIIVAGAGLYNTQSGTFYFHPYSSAQYPGFFTLASYFTNTAGDFANIKFHPQRFIHLNTWYHVAVVYDASSYLNIPAVYVNGNPITVTASNVVAATKNLTPNNSITRIGSVYHAQRNHVEINFDDIRFWTMQRTQEQIQKYMNYRLTGWETGLVAYFNCDKVSATTLYDNQKDGIYNGTIYAGVTFGQD